MNNKLIGYLAIATAVCFAACAANKPGGKDPSMTMMSIGITGPTTSPSQTAGLTGYLMVKYDPDGGCPPGATWQYNGGASLPVGPTAYLFTATQALKPVTVSVPNHQPTTFYTPVTDELTLKYKISCK